MTLVALCLVPHTKGKISGQDYYGVKVWGPLSSKYPLFDDLNADLSDK